jgi:signal transduction histidine kinase
LRRRLALLSLATTALVVISFLIPLGLLVRRQAADRARVAAERTAQSTASLIALTVTPEAEAPAIESAIGDPPEGLMVALSDGSVLGRPLPGQGSLVDTAFRDQATVTALVSGGWELALPVIGREETAVVDVLVTDEKLTEGVVEAWVLLGLLGVALIGAASFLADRLGRRLVQPIADLVEAAHRLGEGDLEARVEIAEPEEVRDVAEAFNTLARRLDQLLEAEREAAADFSHRLRTPLTSLRLQAEKLKDVEEREDLLGQVDRMESAVDRMILATRGQADDSPTTCDLSVVVEERSAFWRVLAEEQGREISIAVRADGVHLGMSADTVEATIDALVGNVFAHTPPGTDFEIAVGETENRPWLQVSDEGAGFSAGAPLDRGVSGGGSTGLGLDIARRTAEMTGGSITINDRPGGGAVVRVWFG